MLIWLLKQVPKMVPGRFGGSLRRSIVPEFRFNLNQIVSKIEFISS